MSKFLDKIGITDPWQQLAIIGLSKTILIFSIPAIIIGVLIGKFL